MKKPHNYRTLSALKCKCGKYIKANVVDRKINLSGLLCYHCYTKIEKARRGVK